MKALFIFFRLGVVRGFILGAISAVLGFFLTDLVRDILGYERGWPVLWDLWTDELVTEGTVFAPGTPVAVPLAIAAVFFAFGLLIGVGSMTDWILWAIGRKGSDGHYHPREGMPRWTRYFQMDTNHKIIGIQYGVLSLLTMGLGGFYAMAFRTELAQSGLQFLSEDTYNVYMTQHGMLMVQAIIIGGGALMNYLVPLMIGAQDMAFPRLNGFAFWILVAGTFLLALTPVFGGADAGWTAYPPLSVKARLGMQFFLIGVFINGFGSIFGSLNIIVTIILMRAPGMTLFRMPIFVWSVLATTLILLGATQFIGLAFLMVLLERLVGIPFFNPELGGNVTLYQHLFWFYSHPVVYVWILPGLGIISELLPVFARKPLFGYVAVALSSLAISLMGFLVWSHHMFTSAMDPSLRIPFMVTTLMIAVPTGVKFFSWLGTLWGGKITFPAPMLFVLGAFMTFLLGGLTGPPHALVPTDLHLHDTHFLVAHFHMAAFGGFAYAFVAAIYYWFPKASGRMYNETIARIQFVLLFGGFTTFTLALSRIGLLGMRRHIPDYDPALGFDPWNTAATLGGYAVALSFILMVANVVYNMAFGPKAAANPWRSMGLEWQIASPPSEFNYSELPEVVGNPYDYGLEGAVYAIVAPQDRPKDIPSDLPPGEMGPVIPSTAPAPAGD